MTDTPASVAPSIPPEPTYETLREMRRELWRHNLLIDDMRPLYAVAARAVLASQQAASAAPICKYTDGPCHRNTCQRPGAQCQAMVLRATLRYQAGSAASVAPTEPKEAFEDFWNPFAGKHLCAGRSGALDVWQHAWDAAIASIQQAGSAGPEPTIDTSLMTPTGRADYESWPIGSAAPAPATETLTDAADAAKYRALRTPEVEDFIKAVEREAMFQREKWGADGDAGKTDTDWFWLLGYLGGKAIRPDSTPEKQLHHIITTAAACLNWHAARVGAYTTMRPGIAEPASEKLLMQAGAKENSNAR